MPDVNQMKACLYIFLGVGLACVVTTATALAARDEVVSAMAAYYTRLPIENDDPPDKVGRYPDVVVRIDDTRSFIFSRDSSFLPCLMHGGRKTYVTELAPRRGDGDASRPDKINRFSYVRLIENKPEQVIVHWRYMADFTNVGWDGVVDEYFTIKPTGEVWRVVRKGTPSKRDWDDPANRHVQILRLTADGIEYVENTPPRLSHMARKPVKGRPVIKDKPIDAAWGFHMDEGLREDASQTVELVSGNACRILGHRAEWREGVYGTCLMFDGYYSKVALPVLEQPKQMNQITVQAWVALGAYPFNWGPIVHQSEWEKAGYYLGVDAYGHLGFMAHIGGEWRRLMASTGIHDADLVLFRWHHIAASYDGKAMHLYLDGNEVASMPATGTISLPERGPVIGLNTDKLKPTSAIRDWATYPSIFGIDGLIDEVIVHDKALGAARIADFFKNAGLSTEALAHPDLESRNLPANTQGRMAEAFRASYRNLGYHAGFDNLWRVSDHPDVIVEFDQCPCRLVFWKGLRYAPALVTENGKWSGDQSAECGENWGKQLSFDYPDAVGCCEHMSDAQARHSHVRIIENTPARAVVHWRYAEIDVRYTMPHDDDGWGAWADEYYTVYPDGAAIRHVARCVGGWQETMFYNAPGSRPEDNVNLEAYTLVNAAGEQRSYSWATAPNPYPDIPGKLDLMGDTFVSMVNLKSVWRPYYIYAAGAGVRAFCTEVRPEFSRFPWWNHYPVSQAISDGRSAERADRMTHSSLVWGKPGTDCMMIGLTDRRPAELLPLAKSWAHAPRLEVVSGCLSKGYNPARREYPLVATAPSMAVRVVSSEFSPVHNLCFTVSNWGHRGEATIEIDGKPANRSRQGTFHGTDGAPVLVVFVELETDRQVGIAIHGARPVPGDVAPAERSKHPD